MKRFVRIASPRMNLEQRYDIQVNLVCVHFRYIAKSMRVHFGRYGVRTRVVIFRCYQIENIVLVVYNYVYASQEMSA